MINLNKKNIQILDCTLRDGGLALQDLHLNNEAYDPIENKNSFKVMDALSDAGIDMIEVGSIDPEVKKPNDFFIYKDIQSLSKTIPSQRDSAIYVGLFRGPDTDLKSIPDYDESLCQHVRVIIRYSELQKSIDFCAGLANKGYKVFIQPMVTMRYDASELCQLIDSANQMNAYAMYLVDSYGYMNHQDIDGLFLLYDQKLDPSIRIGLHAHNNMNLAFSNTQHFMNRKTPRQMIVDSTISGMGQGAGNMQTELLVPYMNEYFNCAYNLESILKASEIIEPLAKFGRWGYSITNLLPAIHKTAYKFSLDFRRNFKLNYSQINFLLSNIPEEFRHRYTKENAKQLLELFAKEVKERIDK